MVYKSNFIAIPDIPARAIGLVERQDKRHSPAAVAFLQWCRGQSTPPTGGHLR